MILITKRQKTGCLAASLLLALLRSWGSETGFYEPIFHAPEGLKGAKEAAVREYMLLHHVPVIRWIGNVSIAFYVLFLFVIFAAVNKIDWLVPFTPALVTLGFVVIGPVLYGHPRYMFPVIYGLPSLIVFVLYRTAFPENSDRSSEQ